MTTRDLVDTLREAIERTDSDWMSQPSYLRRRLNEVLGVDAATFRAQIHQLIVAAEERVPIRLQRNGWSAEQRADLAQLMVATRGWTSEAADWAVTTWAAALGLCAERPPIPARRTRPSGPPGATVLPDGASSPSEPQPTLVPGDLTVPREGVPSPTQDRIGSEMGPDATVIPPPFDPAPVDPAPTVMPPPFDPAPVDRAPAVIPPPFDPAPVDPAPAVIPPPFDPAPVDPAPAVMPPPASLAVPLPSSQMARRGTKQVTKAVVKALGHEVDVAYEVKVGPTPAWLFLALPIGLVALVSPPVLVGPVMLVFLLIVLGGRTVWPKRVLAVSGNRVWLFTSGVLKVAPKELIFEGTRNEIEFAGGRPFPSVRFGGERLWFLLPVTSAARQLPTTDAGRSG